MPKLFRNLLKALRYKLYLFDFYYKTYLSVGKKATFALRDGFVNAEKYRAWDGWSLTQESITYIAKLILEKKIKRIIEFGAGYSTIVLAEFIRQVSPQVEIDSFEHQKEFEKKIRKFLPEVDINFHFERLLQVDDKTFLRLFNSHHPFEEFFDNAKEVPYSQLQETRLKNTFYGYDFRAWKSKSIDLIILDGPNGNGRSLAFPFLKEKIKLPGWLLIDDYLDYPFLDDLNKVFEFSIENHVEKDEKEWALIKLISMR